MTREEALNILHNASVYHPDYLDALNMAIKALKQEPCEDCVSRQAVHNMLEDVPIVNTDKWFNWLQKACLRLADLPPVTPTQRWIPVSERLPENDEVVLGTNSSNDLFETNTWDDCGEIKWYANGCFDVPIIAWMPLPEPYKAEMESEE